jgi:hypothetical protein
MLIKIFLILFEVGFGVKFDIVGTISLSELFLIFSAPFFINKRIFLKYPELNKITLLYFCLFCVQIISEVIVGNSMDRASKGIALTVVSYVHFVFLFLFFCKNINYIGIILIGSLACQAIFPPQITQDIVLDNKDISDILKGEARGGALAFLKFHIVPMISTGLMIVSTRLNEKKTSLLLLFTGGLSVVLGARSSGAIILLTGIISFFILSKKTYSFRKNVLITISVVGLIVGYGLYAIYVNKVLTGEIKSGNSWQLLQVDKIGANPYNPLALLIMGRTEVFAGLVAFSDKFWTGHGAWAADVKYTELMYLLRDSDGHVIYERSTFDAHSVLVGSAVQNGVFAFLCMLGIFCFFLKRGFKLFSRKSPYSIIIIYFVFWALWVGLFSPISHFRITLPLAFAFLMVSYRIINDKNG